MSHDAQVFRSAGWMRLLLALGVGLSVAGATILFSQGPGVLYASGLAALALLFVVGLAESLTSRVALDVDALRIRSNFRNTTVPRAQIVRVSGEKGVAVAVQLQSGAWLKLPSHGGGPHASTVRAWLARTAAAADTSPERSTLTR